MSRQKFFFSLARAWLKMPYGSNCPILPYSIFLGNKGEQSLHVSNFDPSYFTLHSAYTGMQFSKEVCYK